jgi:archaellum biogenesis ATPase FlaH
VEPKLLAAAAQAREAWAAVQSIVTKEELSPEGQVILALLSDFYNADKNANKADLEILHARAGREIASTKLAEVIQSAVKRLGAENVSGVNVVKEAVAIKAHSLGLKLATRLTSGKADPEILTMMDEYTSWMSKSEVDLATDEEIFTGVSAKNLSTNSYSKENLIQLYPKILNDHLDGGIRGGHHILYFGPTEIGKTLFVVESVYGFLRQGLVPLYCGNEDPAADIQLRVMTRLTGMNKYEILAEPEKADGLLAKRNWCNFVFANLAPGTFPRVRGLVEKYKPNVVILDQLRNFDVFSDSRTQALEKAATEARNLAKRYNIPVLSVTQAADSATGKTILARGDVDSSNVGIPGQCDVMVGIGATEEMENMNMRVLSFPKNKLSGRHSTITVKIDPLLSKVVE